MRKRIIKLSKTSVGITLNSTLLAYLGIERKEATEYALEVSFKDGVLILKNPVKEEKDIKG